jgi:thiol:disulfide interchange protein DsbC
MKRNSGSSFAIIILVGVLGAGLAIASSKGVTRKPEAKAAVPADLSASHNCAGCHSLSKEEAEKIFKGFADEVKEVKASPVKGLYQVTIRKEARQGVVYLDFGKKVAVTGPMFDLATKKPITPPPVELPKILSKAKLDSIPLSNSIIIGDPKGSKRIIVFTDPDCPFCKRLHEELKKLVVGEPDLAVYIKMFPLKMHPGAYDKARVILGSNSAEMLEKAFAGEKLPPPGEKDRKEPVDETLRVGEAIGINGTPAMILPNGQLIEGARDAAFLKRLLNNPK